MCLVQMMEPTWEAWNPSSCSSHHSAPLCAQDTVHRDEKHNKVVVALKQGCQTYFHWGPHQLRCCLQRAERKFSTVQM